MDEHTRLDAGDLQFPGAGDGGVAAVNANCIPWLPGSLLRYLSGRSVLDIKAPGTAEPGPVVPGATVTTLLPSALPSGLFDNAAWPSAACHDAIFSRDALAHADNPGATLAAWFAQLHAGGHLLLLLPRCDTAGARQDAIVPHAEPVVARFGRNVRSTTPEALMRLVETALPPGHFAVLHLDTVPSRAATHSGKPAGREVRLVLQKLAQAVPEPAAPRTQPPPATGAAKAAAADALIPFLLASPAPPRAPGMRAEGNLLLRDFAPRPAMVKRILVLKLDHHGDFLIGLPALRELRASYPHAYIRLICGRWNVASARAADVADDVRSFDYFPDRAVDWDGTPATTDWPLFAAATEGHFDIAIDLRVDDDTRALLGRVDAEVRCGIGSQARFPMLDIVLPDAPREVPRPVTSRAEMAGAGTDGSQVIPPDGFCSEMEIRRPGYHETGFPADERCVLRSDEIYLPAGRFSASFDLSARGFLPGLAGAGIRTEVIAGGDRIVATRAFGRRSIFRLNAHSATLEFDSAGPRDGYEFRVHVGGRPLAGRVRFAGLRLRRLDAGSARLRPSELHVGEKLSLLVSLVRARTLPVTASLATVPPPRVDQALQIVVAPFSNSTVRDWPVEHYGRLIGLLTERFDCRVRLVGAPAQAAQATGLISRLPNTVRRDRVSDLVGKTQWSDLEDILRAADLVICNNSGIAHQAAALGVHTLAIFSASHQPLEWGPRGQHARAIMMSVACSPCGYERVEDCGNGHLCMRLITPEIVLAQVARLLSDSGALKKAERKEELLF
jgi:ADP-heptose:LPS heptosyltransferase